MRRFAVLLLLVLLGCGPEALIPGWPSPAPRLDFVVVLHNNDTIATTMTVSWWRASTIVGSVAKSVPAGGSTVYVIGDLPDGIQIDTIAWPAPYGLVFQTPEYRAWKVFHVNYPRGSIWGEVPSGL